MMTITANSLFSVSQYEIRPRAFLRHDILFAFLFEQAALGFQFSRQDKFTEISIEYPSDVDLPRGIFPRSSYSILPIIDFPNFCCLL